MRTRICFAEQIEAPSVPIPKDKRLPFGWRAFPVASQEAALGPTLIHWQDEQDFGEPDISNDAEIYLRLTIALDVREEKRIEVYLLDTQKVIGFFDIRYAYVLQPFEIRIDPQDFRSIYRAGIGLRMLQGDEPLWVFDEREKMEPSTLYVPHLLFSQRKPEQSGLISAGDDVLLEAFFSRMLSFDSVQEFSWMGGCVLDGLLDLESCGKLPIEDAPAPRRVAESHLRLFFDEDDRLVYENPRSIPVDGTVSGIEGTLPFAAIAKIWPNHPSLELALTFWLSHIQENGSIQDGHTLSAEGSYTVAYPLAVLARVQGNREWAKLAAKQLLLRRDNLNVGADLYLRHITGEHEGRTFRHWARAYAWYMLGLTRTLIEFERMSAEIRPDADDLTALRLESDRIAEQALSYQRSDGLWSCFLDDHQVLPDTSGTAGISAALALGAEHGHLSNPGAAFHAAEAAMSALYGYLSPDGLLRGVAQSNRGGEALQRSEYRVLSQMGMGLMAQLYAALKHRDCSQAAES